MNEDLTEAISVATTFLFVPGDRPDRYLKAASAGADEVIVDLEDAVDPEKRPLALANVLAALTGDSDLSACVRINGIGTPTHDDEVRALQSLGLREKGRLRAIVVPKAESAETLGNLTSAFGDIPLIALVESAKGVLESTRLASVPGIVRLAFGAVDFGVDLGVGVESDVHTVARSALVMNSRAAGLAAPIDSPSLAITDGELVLREGIRAKAGGFAGKLCIHPSQVAVVKKAFAPSEEEVRWAQATLDAAKGDGAATVEGAMIDRPVLARARQILGVAS